MFEKRRFNLGRVFTEVFLGFIVSFIGCKVAGFVCGTICQALEESDTRDHADDFLGDGFVRAS